MQRLSLVVADDDTNVRSALCAVLAADGGFDIVASVGTGDEAARCVARHRPDLALLDVRMPGGGPDVIRALRRSAPGTVVVAISAHTNAGGVAELLRAGICGFLAKGSTELSLPDSLRRCARGEVVLAVPTGAAALSMLVAS